MKPNIFSLATSELSQDAFFTWLLQWGDNSVAIVKDAFLADKDDNFDFENFLNILRKVEKTLDDYKKEKTGKE